ncbi:hypothetical protein [Nonomuraea sediminis]|uniref:hypothetical protein n=1 Tax=Nonomuraea sediminis TaxID=2835864 RepID=UPI001BDCC9E1|nr:hypothetical protein [Nonomuraea sediminis]
MTRKPEDGPRIDTVPGTSPLLAARRFFTEAEVSADGRTLHQIDPSAWDRDPAMTRGAHGVFQVSAR